MVDLVKLEERRRLASDLASELGDAGFISWMNEAYEAAEAISDAQDALTSAKAEIERLKEVLRHTDRALTEVMGWIENWDAPFTEDAEWPETLFHAKEASKQAAAAIGEKEPRT